MPNQNSISVSNWMKTIEMAKKTKKKYEIQRVFAIWPSQNDVHMPQLLSFNILLFICGNLDTETIFLHTIFSRDGYTYVIKDYWKLSFYKVERDIRKKKISLVFYDIWRLLKIVSNRFTFLKCSIFYLKR